MNYNKIVQYNFPTIIRFGPGSVKELGAYLSKNGLSRPLIVTDPTVAQLQFFRGDCEGPSGPEYFSGDLL